MNDHTPRVSVGLPVYNGERYLSEAIDSILAQTFEDFELIISDNGSTDTTEQICRTYAAQDQRIRYCRNEENLGGSWNFRRVVELSRGEYFKWAAHDDLIAPEYLQRCVDILDQMPLVILCYTKAIIIDEYGKQVQQFTDDLNLRSTSAYERYKQYHYYYHYRDDAKCNVQFSLIRRSVLQQTPLIAPYVHSDYNLIGELALRGQFYEIPEYLFLRRDHPLVTHRALPTNRERMMWFDPAQARKGKGGHPGWRMLFEHVRSITRVSMSPYDKVRCYLLAGRYFIWLAQGSIRTLRGGGRKPLSQALKQEN